ncbi:MAG TPA: hypothetical protein ENN55_00055 [Firmicutes bacterium]|nr:hypothetical protein [Bacillota bacterium]
MTIRLLTKTELAAINRKNSIFDLATAEKDYMLAVTVDIISKSQIAGKLVFKGGTAIHQLSCRVVGPAVLAPPLRFENRTFLFCGHTRQSIDEVFTKKYYKINF